MIAKDLLASFRKKARFIDWPEIRFRSAHNENPYDERIKLTLPNLVQAAEPVVRELLGRDSWLSDLEVTSAGLEEAFLALTQNHKSNGSN